jgi:adenylate cyclase
MARSSGRRKASQPEKLLESARRADSQPELVAAAKFLRGLLPGRESERKSSAARKRRSQSLERLVSGFEPERPSATRELGHGAMKAWQALSESQRRRRGTADVAILFTDLVGFSSWALKAGDEAALELLDQVGGVEEDAVSDNGGIVVKRLGDGSMAVFSEAEPAVSAALEAQEALGEIEVEGYAPSLRAGVHVGRPRRVKRDFLGVDVNIAARVGELAKGDEVLASDAACEALDSSAFKLGPARELSAPGAPDDLTVCAVKAKRKG